MYAIATRPHVPLSGGALPYRERPNAGRARSSVRAHNAVPCQPASDKRDPIRRSLLRRSPRRYCRIVGPSYGQLGRLFDSAEPVAVRCGLTTRKQATRFARKRARPPPRVVGASVASRPAPGVARCPSLARLPHQSVRRSTLKSIRVCSAEALIRLHRRWQYHGGDGCGIPSGDAAVLVLHVPDGAA